ncbi:MAG: L-threonylcarbamoyladenylate synthase, partial [Candidatus Methanomethylicaceae archaeon]
VYGIGGDPFKEEVVKRIVQIKERGEREMPVLVASLEKAKELVEFDEIALRLANKFWPGPLTIVLRRRVELPKELTAGRDTLGLRVPKNLLALKIIEASGGVLIGTSANISGRPPPRSADDVDEKVQRSVDLVVDGGRSELGVASTVVEVLPPLCEGKGYRIKVIREGAIKAEVVKGIIREDLD